FARLSSSAREFSLVRTAPGPFPAREKSQMSRRRIRANSRRFAVIARGTTVAPVSDLFAGRALHPFREDAYVRTKLAIGVMVAVVVLATVQLVPAQFFRVKDPGVRGGAAGAGGPFAALSTAELEMFTDGLKEFSEEDAIDEGLGPRFNFV